MISTISTNISKLRNRIDAAASSCDRDPEDILLIAVSKNQSKDKIIEAIEAGERDFGESKVQEALTKWPGIKALYPDVKLHLIGHLQSNKIHHVAGLFDYIHSVDSIKIAKNLSEEIKYFIQVNVANEQQKFGVSYDHLDEMVKSCQKDQLIGLMCIPPLKGDSLLYFNTLRSIGVKYGLRYFSMGMSNDFEKAIAAGATHIRVGTAIFGDR